MSATQAGGTAQAWGFAPDTRLYLGAGIGGADQNEFKDGNSGAGKVFAGIRYRAIGGEVAYLQTGEAEDSAATAREPDLKSSVRGLSAAAVGYMPVNARTEIMGKLGAAYWDQTNSSEVKLTDVRSESSDNGFSPLLGIGAQYRLFQNMNLRGEWERIFSAGEGAYESDIDMLTLGISMSTL